MQRLFIITLILSLTSFGLFLSSSCYANTFFSDKESSFSTRSIFKPASPVISIQLSGEKMDKLVQIATMPSIGIKYRDINNYWFVGLKSSVKHFLMGEDEFMFVSNTSKRKEFTQLYYTSLFFGGFYPVVAFKNYNTLTVDLEGAFIVLKNRKVNSGYYGFSIAPSLSLHKLIQEQWIFTHTIGLKYNSLTNAILDGKNGSLANPISAVGLFINIELGYAF
ncbi:hypothetical protein DID80_02580 [Candidatus Marinamargulisbacteria bacterium SCGC AAA071-K20]|nr:hypothetical protein DID80_02580 [Candidatus Marinamargulisbacteria bacterium SCGC AAA071-K20]